MTNESRLRSSSNWPYVAFWREKLGGGAGGGREGGGAAEGAAARGGGEGGERGGFGAAHVPACPVLFMWGGAKPCMFHSDRWLEEVANKHERDGCSGVVEVKGAGHWFPVTHAAFTGDVLDAWLSGRALPTGTRSRL